MNYYWARNDEIEDENISEVIAAEPWKQDAEYQAADAAFNKALAKLHTLRDYSQGFYGPELHDDGREFQRLLELKRTTKWMEKEDYIKYMRLEEKRLGALPQIRKTEATMGAATKAKIAAIQRYTGL